MYIHIFVDMFSILTKLLYKIKKNSGEFTTRTINKEYAAIRQPFQ